MLMNNANLLRVSYAGERLERVLRLTPLLAHSSRGTFAGAEKEKGQEVCRDQITVIFKKVLGFIN